MRKCQAFAQRGWNISVTEKQSGARVNGAINSAVEKLCESWKMKNRQTGNLTQ